MITLYTFGPGAGLPDLSPFVMKADMLLKLAGLAYQTNRRGMRRAPKGKLPYIQDGSALVADSTFIRAHLEARHGVDFDAGYGPAERALGWTVEKMLENHLYFALVHARWIDEANFRSGPAHYFNFLPFPVRGLVRTMVRNKIRKQLDGQGMGRHSPADIALLAQRDLDALSVLLGDKPYLLGERPSGADATVFGFVAAALSEQLDSPIRAHAAGLPNLVAYRDRLMALHYPAFA